MVFFVIRKSIIIFSLSIVILFGFGGCQGNTDGNHPIDSPTIIEETNQNNRTDSSTSGQTPPALIIRNSPEPRKTNQIDGALLVYVDSGSFDMGAEPERSFDICINYRDDCSLEDFIDEAPVHEVVLNSFWIYAQEVTNEQYRLCVQGGGCNLPAFTDFYNHPDYADHPVVYVSWYDAKDYCEWGGGRLPTEAEWEKVARGEDGRMFPWGNLTVDCGFANLSGCSSEMTMSSGSLSSGASPYGALDMAGNVAEWVADWYDPYYYAESSNNNPAGPPTGEMKVIRGGSWKNPGVGLRSSNRGANFPEIFSTGVGFRCVLEE